MTSLELIPRAYGLCAVIRLGNAELIPRKASDNFRLSVNWKKRGAWSYALFGELGSACGRGSTTASTGAPVAAAVTITAHSLHLGKLHYLLEVSI